MASTLSSATMTIRIVESIKLNGTEQGAVNIKTISSINEISKRIVTITTTEATVLTFAAAIAGGTHITQNVKYMRFTNKDDTYFITLTFRNQDNDEVAIKLDAGQSFIWNADNSDGLVDVFNATQDADAASDTALGSLTNIQADASASTCDLEMFIAST